MGDFLSLSVGVVVDVGRSIARISSLFGELLWWLYWPFSTLSWCWY